MENFEDYQIGTESTLDFVKLLRKIKEKDLSWNDDLFIYQFQFENNKHNNKDLNINVTNFYAKFDSMDKD